MIDTIINVEGIGKKYRIRHKQPERYSTLRDMLADKVLKAFRRTQPGVKELPTTEDFWALKDVSFEVKRGEVVGVIGRNGAGKSTLLKILTRITEPTEGRVEIDGRVASLLEVGTGFHPELTGRENIYLNGAILGMTRAEIHAKFDEIVAFAEVDTFLDTPVKRYSSGMYVRLAFAVAAHLEPEILLVDEVLAVGDAEFQKKCLGKMSYVAREGRTVLFVSHNMAAVNQLCETGLWLQDGHIQLSGSITDVTQAYMHSVHNSERTGIFSADHGGDGQVNLISYRVTNAVGEANPPPVTKADMFIYVRINASRRIAQPAYGISIVNAVGVLMTSINTVEQGVTPTPLLAGEVTISIKVKNVSFLPGIYTASFWVMGPQGHIYAMAENSIVFEIAQAPIYGTCHVDHRWGCVFSDIQFSVSTESATLNMSTSIEHARQS
jgi:lipopolysaccharide transport system ATP-binding protein